jgi:hypothetical protein
LGTAAADTDHAEDCHSPTHSWTAGAEEELPVILNADELVAYLLDNPADYSSDDFLTLLLRLDRNAVPHVIAELYYLDALDWGHAPRVVPSAWCGAEYPMRALNAETWRDLFWVAGYTYNGRRRAKPRKPRLLFRGAADDHRHGWSWTENSAQAAAFAERSIRRGNPARVWQATVEPDRLLARITTVRPGENEWVVDAEGLLVSACADTTRPATEPLVAAQ